ncbi:DUF4232 domain-containing protein [Arthrobacter sp. NamB2]|uniref:DUF4232 domain-containing protein n=1 Tax=Arthrobacter sp. NamB2 TaxID=2576035 RepID=UPI0010C98491|nr:DUF4232 domain-containing protein [Arthrobacter sp. NamB2]TKV27380.1 DUF4232 domain-containing protein [Arthrobacter sp. NamB2]
MTELLGSKRWIAAAAAAGALVAMSGCSTASEPDGGRSVSPSAGTTSEAPTSSAEPSSSATPSPSPSPTVSAGPTAGTTPSPSPGSSSPAPAAGAPCTAAQLAGSVEDQPGGGAAGSVYRTLVLTNTSDQECAVEGYPGVSFVDAAGTQIGAGADRDGSASSRVSLAPGTSATATLQQTNAQNYGEDCGLTPAAGLRVYPPGATDSLVLPQEIPACSATSIVLMTVGTLQPAA